MFLLKLLYSFYYAYLFIYLFLYSIDWLLVLWIMSFSAANSLDESELARKIVHQWEEGITVIIYIIIIFSVEA